MNAAAPGSPAPRIPDFPRFVEVAAPDDWRTIDFISDLHLSEATPRAVEALEHYLRSTPAEAVWILGDLFEVWVGDDAREGRFERHCVELLAEAACRRSIHFMHGNRDFLVGHAMVRACGMTALADPTVLVAFGQRLLVTHGDALCIADTDYQAFRLQVRSDGWQRSFLERTLAARRQIAREMREKSRARHRQRRGDFADVDPAAAVKWLHLAGARTLLHGHTHRPSHEVLAPGFERLVLSDWCLEPDAPGERRAEALRWTADGFVRVAIGAAAPPLEMASPQPT